MSSHPNLVIVYPDQFRQQALGCMGQDPVVTPNLDRMAREGLVLTRAVSNRPVCSPHRAMLMTGKYPHANGVLGNCNSRTAAMGNQLRQDDVCLSDVLAAAGYELGYIGKLHLDSPVPPYDHTEGPRGDGVAWDAYTPPGPRRHAIGFWHSYGCCDDHLHPHYWHAQAALHERTDVAEWSVKHETDVAVDFIRNRGACRQAGRPFALIVAHNPPHPPFDHTPRLYTDRYGDAGCAELLNRPNLASPQTSAGQAARKHVRNYFGAITGIDDQFGRILQALADEGIDRDTIVIFTSDHGEMMGSHGLMHKVVWHEESVRVPMLIRWPGAIAPRRDDLLLGTPDLMPTLLTMMRLGDRIPAGVQGSDLSKTVMTGKGPRPETALYLNVQPDDPAGGARGLITDRYTFVAAPKGAQTMTILHDNREDPYQLRNLAAERRNEVRELGAELRRRVAQTGDPWRPAEA